MCHTPDAPSEVASGRPDRPGGMYPLRVGVTMSLHKLTAGSGYDYLTRQVAALDATEKGHTGLASYYTERGETPGVWIGSGIGRDRRPDRRRSGDCGADASVVRLRSASVGRAPPAAAGRTRPHRTGLSGRGQAGGAVQDRRWCRQPVPARSGETHRGDQYGGRPAAGAAAAGCRSGAGADRGGPGVLPRRARPGADGCPGAGGTDRERFAAAHADGCWL